MWKKAFRILLESCVYMDPIAFMYYSAAKRGAESRAWIDKDEADERELRRLIEKIEERREALA